VISENPRVITTNRSAAPARDPFDRLPAAQALTENAQQVSGDAAFDLYGAQRICRHEF